MTGDNTCRLIAQATADYYARKALAKREAAARVNDAIATKPEEGPRRPTHAEAAAILNDAERQINAVCQPETPKPDPTTAAERLATVVAARKARTPRKPRKADKDKTPVAPGVPDSHPAYQYPPEPPAPRDAQATADTRKS
jgi:hypothetical protein